VPTNNGDEAPRVNESSRTGVDALLKALVGVLLLFIGLYFSRSYLWPKDALPDFWRSQGRVNVQETIARVKGPSAIDYKTGTDIYVITRDASLATGLIISSNLTVDNSGNIYGFLEMTLTAFNEPGHSDISLERSKSYAVAATPEGARILSKMHCWDSSLVPLNSPPSDVERMADGFLVYTVNLTPFGWDTPLEGRPPKQPCEELDSAFGGRSQDLRQLASPTVTWITEGQDRALRESVLAKWPQLKGDKGDYKTQALSCSEIAVLPPATWRFEAAGETPNDARYADVTEVNTPLNKCYWTTLALQKGESRIDTIPGTLAQYSDLSYTPRQTRTLFLAAGLAGVGVTFLSEGLIGLLIPGERRNVVPADSRGRKKLGRGSRAFTRMAKNRSARGKRRRHKMAPDPPSR